MGKEISDADLLGGSDSGWDEHSAEDGQEIDLGTEDPQKEIEEGLDDDDGLPLVPKKKKEPDPDLDQDENLLADDEDEEPEPDQDEGLESEELTEWEKKNYSAAMQKRVTRERRLKREAEEKYEQESGHRHTAERDAYESKKLALTLLAKDVERDIKDKTADLKKAKEEGDTDVEVAALGELDDLRARKREIEGANTSLKEPVKVERQTLAPTTKRWMERNRWFADQTFTAEAGYARSIDVALSQEGKFTAGTPEYFAELDRRIHANIPALRTKIKKSFGNAPASRLAPVNRGGPLRTGNPARGKVTLSRQDLENARSFGLTTPEQLKAYAIQKHQNDREDLNNSRRGGR